MLPDESGFVVPSCCTWPTDAVRLSAPHLAPVAKFIVLVGPEPFHGQDGVGLLPYAPLPPARFWLRTQKENPAAGDGRGFRTIGRPGIGGAWLAVQAH